MKNIFFILLLTYSAFINPKLQCTPHYEKRSSLSLMHGDKVGLTIQLMQPGHPNNGNLLKLVSIDFDGSGLWELILQITGGVYRPALAHSPIPVRRSLHDE